MEIAAPFTPKRNMPIRSRSDRIFKTPVISRMWKDVLESPIACNAAARILKIVENNKPEKNTTKEQY